MDIMQYRGEVVGIENLISINETEMHFYRWTVELAESACVHFRSTVAIVYPSGYSTENDGKTGLLIYLELVSFG